RRRQSYLRFSFKSRYFSIAAQIAGSATRMTTSVPRQAGQISSAWRRPAAGFGRSLESLAESERAAENFTSLTNVYSPLNQIGFRFGQDKNVVRIGSGAQSRRKTNL